MFAPQSLDRLYHPSSLCHPDFPIGARVRIKALCGEGLAGLTGEVIGVAADLPVATQYIVLLDTPRYPAVKWPGGPFRGISISGACLEY